jgi:hypothetical protein
MDWWVRVILVALVLAGVLAFFEWRSRNRPLGRGIEGFQGGPHEQADTGGYGRDPFGTRSSVEKPRD